MPNTLVASIYIPFAIATLIILVEVSLRNIRHKGNYLFIFLCLLVVGWYATDIAGALTTNEEVAKLFWNLILIFVGLIPPALLLFVLDFYRVSYRFTERFTPSIFIVPSITVVMVLSSGFHPLLYKQLDIISLSPIHEVVRVWGPWFWVHTVHCYIISVAIITIILIQHVRSPKFYRLPSTLMTLGISLTLFGNVVTLLQLLPAALDPTLLGTSLALIFFNFAIINNDRSKFIRYSHGKVFDYLDIYIFVMDESNHAVYANRPAVEWSASLGVAPEAFEIDGMLELLISKGAVRKDLEDEGGTDIYFPADPFPMVLNMHVQKMVDKNEVMIGSVVIFTDVTQNRLLLDRLEKKAGIDSLTGLANHMAYMGAKRRLDAPEHLPLSVIMCDVNGLKTVNDNLGHKYGDMMLQVVAGVLETVCSKSQFIARIGGDEFIFLLSHTSPEDAALFMEKIRTSLSAHDNLPFALSVALGTATKHSFDQGLSDIINLADSRMYENKKFIKSQQ